MAPFSFLRSDSRAPIPRQNLPFLGRQLHLFPANRKLAASPEGTVRPFPQQHFVLLGTAFCPFFQSADLRAKVKAICAGFTP